MPRFELLPEEATGGATPAKGRFELLPEEPKKVDKLKLADQEEGSILSGIKMGLKDPFVAGAQLISHALPEGFKNKAAAFNDALVDLTGSGEKIGDTTLDQRIKQDEENYQAARKEAGREGLDIARLGGNILPTAPLVLNPLVALKAGKNALDVGNMFRSAAQAGAIGGLQPVTENQENFGEEKAKQIGTSSALGFAAAPASAAIGRALSPQVAPEVELLRQRGVQGTPGQTLGGLAQRAEDKLTSMIGVGDAIVSRRLKNQEAFNRAAYAEALKGTGVDATKLPVGREGVQAVKEAVTKQYDDLLSKMVWKPDPTFAQEITKIAQMSSGMGQDQQRKFLSVVNNIMSKSKNGVMLGDVYKTIESQVGKDARSYLSSANAMDREVGAALSAVLQSMKDTLRRTNPMHAKQLDIANNNYANYTRIRTAGSSTADQTHGFTPAALASAVKNQDKSLGHGKYAGGRALMQDLSDAGVKVLGSKVPDSGTAGRLFMAGGLGAAAYANPLLLVGGAAATLPYTKSGQKIINALLTQRPGMSKQAAEKTANVLLRTAPFAAVGLANE